MVTTCAWPRPSGTCSRSSRATSARSSAAGSSCRSCAARTWTARPTTSASTSPSCDASSNPTRLTPLTSSPSPGSATGSSRDWSQCPQQQCLTGRPDPSAHLRLFQLPVLDVERLALSDGAVAAERLGSEDDPHRVPVDVGHHLSLGECAPGRHEPEPGLVTTGRTLTEACH